MEEVAISRVGASDIENLLPLMRAYCAFYESAPTDAALRALITALIADPAHEGLQLIARRADGAAVGFATLYWSWSSTTAQRLAIMNDLFVAPQARGGGLAEALIDACRAEAAHGGAPTLAWQTAPDNHRAQAVYDRVGGTREQWVDYWIAT